MRYFSNMGLHHINYFKLALLTVLLALIPYASCASEAYIEWQDINFSITEPLGGLKGDPVRGRRITAAQDKGNCLACHQMPVPEESFHGMFGPPLNGIASRMTEGQIRLRIVDETRINPATVMPAFYKNPKYLNRVSDEYYGKTVLTAQEVEDIVAYLVTLK